MDLFSTSRGTGSVRILCQLAAEHGMVAADALRDTGIGADQLASADGEIAAQQEIQVVRNLVAGLGHVPGLGLEAGLRYHLSTYGIWGFALLTSPTYRAAAEIVERFLGLSFALVGFRLEEKDGRARMVLDDAETPPDIRQFALERDFAAWRNATLELQPRGLLPEAVYFSFPRPGYADRFAEICGVMPEFDAGENVIVIHRDRLDEPLPQANPATARMCLDQCRQLMSRRRHRDGIAGRVREQLFMMTGQLPSLERTAAALNVSTRTLRRQLQQEGTSFRVLASEVLESMAEGMLLTTDMKLEEIALRLGYSEPAAFIHAFRGWTGEAPGAYRDSRSGAAGVRRRLGYN